MHDSFNFIKENVNTFYSESTCSDLGDIETFSPYHKLIVVKGYYLVLNTSIECNFNDDGHTEEMKQHKIEMITPGGVMIEKWSIVKNIMMVVMAIEQEEPLALGCGFSKFYDFYSNNIKYPDQT